MRLIDADKIDFNKVFIGASDFAKDTRMAAQELIDLQPTIDLPDKITKRIKEIKSSTNYPHNFMRQMVEDLEWVLSLLN